MNWFAIIGEINLLFQFPFLIIGIGIVIWAVYHWRTNKSLYAHSHKTVAVILIGMVMVLTGCIIVTTNQLLKMQILNQN